MTVMDRRCFAPSASIPLLFDFYVLVFDLILNDPKINLWCALVQINCHLGTRSNNTEMNGNTAIQSQCMMIIGIGRR